VNQPCPETQAISYSHESAVLPAQTIAPGLAPGIDATARLT